MVSGLPVEAERLIGKPNVRPYLRLKLRKGPEFGIHALGRFIQHLANRDYRLGTTTCVE